MLTPVPRCASGAFESLSFEFLPEKSKVILYALSPSLASYHVVFHSLLESRSAAAHNFALANKLGTELRTVQRQVNIKVDTVECALGCIHALKVLLEVLS
jgi:hypothetical protein